MRPCDAARPLLALAVALAGCADSLNRFTVNSTAPVLKAGSRALDEESDPEFAREAAPGSLKTVETFLVTTPDNPDLLEILAKGYTEFTFGFLEDDLESLPEGADDAVRQRIVDRATAFYDRGLRYALRLAAIRDRHITAAIEGDATGLEKLLDEAFERPEDAPGLYWAGLAMGSGINLHKDDVDRVADLPKVIALLERAHTLDRTYANHGAAMSLGVLLASRGRAMGGDPERARKLFDEVIEATGGHYLMARVLFARFYATVVQDRTLFESTLKDVLATPGAVMPEQRLANELAKRRAARYLKQIDDLFLPPEPTAGAR